MTPVLFSVRRTPSLRWHRSGWSSSGRASAGVAPAAAILVNVGVMRGDSGCEVFVLGCDGASKTKKKSAQKVTPAKTGKLEKKKGGC